MYHLKYHVQVQCGPLPSSGLILLLVYYFLDVSSLASGIKETWSNFKGWNTEFMNKKNKMKIDCGGPRFYPEMLVVLVLEISEIIIILKSCQTKSYSKIKYFQWNWKITYYYVLPQFWKQCHITFSCFIFKVFIYGTHHWPYLTIIFQATVISTIALLVWVERFVGFLWLKCKYSFVRTK